MSSNGQVQKYFQLQRLVPKKRKQIKRRISLLNIQNLYDKTKSIIKKYMFALYRGEGYVRLGRDSFYDGSKMQLSGKSIRSWCDGSSD